MVWPIHSPNMNSIKHLWNIAERVILVQDPVPTNISELWIALETAYLNFSPEVFQPLGELIPYDVTELHWARAVLHGNTRHLFHHF